MSCQNNQQHQDLITAVNSALKKFSPVPIENLVLPKSVKTKGRPPKKSIGSRIPLGWEQLEEEAKEKQKLKEKEAKQLKEKKPLSPSNKPLIPHQNKQLKKDEPNMNDELLKNDKSTIQPLPEIMHFVNGNHFQTIKTKQFPQMTWPPILPQSMAIWESCGQYQSEYKAAWKYIYRKKYPKITSTNRSSKQPIVIEDDNDKASSKDKVLEELREKLKAIEAMWYR
ncbi:hypothetical protein BDA99DRAFT_566275 [Phascolomyces articulosus]|uniref:Uncharacterized protein n=1 Tax=Phascolomyces articulosus TaxID=60185 RepID=A0AAD5JWP5_9FUNG|nr:hypothetical protein BDA99DRAFT_566275 [Phascolomyces articulosus]